MATEVFFFSFRSDAQPTGSAAGLRYRDEGPIDGRCDENASRLALLPADFGEPRQP